ncbi:MAG: hypothetical protein ACKVVP_19075 [Chloroflexota bacterium]
MMSSTMHVEFDEPRLADEVEKLTAEAVDRLSFGVIRVDTAGVVQCFSKPEGDLSGYGSRPALGLNFFTDIAPCMNNDQFLGRIEHARATGTLDIEFGYVGDFSDKERELRVRIQSSSTGGYWIFIQRL